MADLSPDTVALWVSRDITNENFRTLLDVTTDVLGSRLPGKSPEERAELAEVLVPRIVPALERISQDLLDDGIVPNFELASDEATFHIKATSSEASRYRDRLYGFSPTEFERFCGQVLEAMGGRATVTGKPGDGGNEIQFKGVSKMLKGEKTIHIDIPVKLEEVKVVFSIVCSVRSETKSLERAGHLGIENGGASGGGGQCDAGEQVQLCAEQRRILRRAFLWRADQAPGSHQLYPCLCSPRREASEPGA